MADQIPTQPNGDAAQSQTGNQAAAPLTVINQYLKDFSFENPNAANGFQPATISAHCKLAHATSNRCACVLPTPSHCA